MLVRTHIFPCTMYTLFDHRARSHTRCKSTTAITPCYTSFLWSNWSFFQNHYSSRVQGFFSLHSAQHCTDDTSNNIRYPELSLAIGIPDGPVEKNEKIYSCLSKKKKKKSRKSRKRIQIYGLPKDKSWYTINTYLDASLSCLVFLLNDLGLGRWFPK